MSKMKCKKCNYVADFIEPDYSNYHQNFYATEHKRTTKTDPQMKYILNKLAIKENDFVLDIGCGAGEYTKEVATYTDKVVGFDLSVELARKKYPHIQFIQADCNNPFPFENDTVDCIIAVNLIEHLKDHELFLTECRRILKKGGKIALTTANLDFVLHDYFYDPTHLWEWNKNEFRNVTEKYFDTIKIKKSSGMYKYYPYNLIATKFLLPDILFIGSK